MPVVELKLPLANKCSGGYFGDRKRECRSGGPGQAFQSFCKRRSNVAEECASTLQIALSTGLISISVILFAIAAPTIAKKTPRHDRKGFQLTTSAPVLTKASADKQS